MAWAMGMGMAGVEKPSSGERAGDGNRTETRAHLAFVGVTEADDVTACAVDTDLDGGSTSAVGIPVAVTCDNKTGQRGYDGRHIQQG